MQELVVLCVGTVTEHKRQFELVYAFNSALNRIQDKGAKLHLVVVGFTGRDVAYESRIRSITERSRYKERFHFLPKGEAYAYFEAADLYVLPSRLESFGLTLLEASYANLPIITTGTDGIRDVLNENQAMILPVNWNETADGQLATAIVNFHSNPNGYAFRWACRRARHRVENEYGLFSFTYTRILSVMLLSRILST
jgi:glycosyltransferase involved in cell wall biosynthesis